MDFSKTTIYQRTRSCYDKLYSEYNQKKSNRRPRNSGGDGETGGVRATARVGEDNPKGKSSGKSSEALRESDEKKDEIDAVGRSTRRGRREELGDLLKKGKNVKGLGLIDESENNDGGGGFVLGLHKPSLPNRTNAGDEDASGSEKVEKKLPRGRPCKKGKTVCQDSLIDEVDDDCDDDDDGVEFIKSSVGEKAEKKLLRGRSRNRGKTMCENSLIDKVEDGFDVDVDGTEFIKNSGGEKAEKKRLRGQSLNRGKTICQKSLIDKVDDDGVEFIKGSGGEKVEKKLLRGQSRNRGKTMCQNSLIDKEDDVCDDDDGVEFIKSNGSQKAEKKLRRGRSRNRGKNSCQNSLIYLVDDDCDDDDDGDDDGAEFIQRPGRNQTKSDVKRVSGIGKTTKDNKSMKTKDSLQNGDQYDDDDVRSYLVDDGMLSKSSGRDDSKSEYGHCFGNTENESETGFLNNTTASNGDCLKGNSGFGDKFDKDNSLSSSGFPLAESEDDEGVVYLGDDITCLDDYDPSHSSRVESNEIKVSPVELDSIIADAEADDSQGLKSPVDEDDSRNLQPPEQDHNVWQGMELTDNAAAAGDQDITVISLSSSSDHEDGEEERNAINDCDDDGSTVLEVENVDELDNKFWARLLRKHIKYEVHEDDNDDCEVLHFINEKFVNESRKKDEKVSVFEPGASKKRYGSDKEMWRATEGGLKKRRTEKLFSPGGGKKYNVGVDETFWQIVDEKGTQTVHKSTSRMYDEFGNKINAIGILTDTIRDERDGDKLLEKYVDIPLEDLPTEKTPVEQVHSYKFKFEDEEDLRPEKIESEMEVDGLFDEMNMCLQLSEIGSSGASVVNCGDTDFLVEGTDQATCCRRGKHHLTINDEFGIICRYCSYVEMEIRDILPPLSKNGKGGHGRHDTDKTEGLNFSDLRLGDCHQDRLLDSKGSEYERGTVWDLVPGIKESMYPHQRDGFEFIWKKIAGGIYIDKLEKSLPAGGSGCIISHAPGTGKSRLTIVFLQAFMKMYPDSRPLIIAPRCMLLTWEEEFKKWKVDFPFYILNNSECSGQEDTRATNLLKQSGNSKSLLGLRLLKLYSWKKKSSVLGITYRLFESLAGEERKRKRTVKNQEDELIRKMLLQVPTLLVLDEGHTPRNDQSLMWKALLNVKTKRSIILSGTPFQNNFDELYNTLCLVNPLLSFGISSISGVDFQKKRGWKNNSAKGQWDSITSSIKKSEENAIRLREMIDPFVHVHKGTILQERLPGLRDALVVLKPTKTQQTLLGRMSGTSLTIENDRLMSLVSVHPSLLPKSSENEGFHKVLKVFKNDPRAGVKTHFLIELIKLSGALNEKVLVFSQWIKPLEFIMELLKNNFRWVEGRECLYMDGQQEEKHRQTSINTLNDPKSEVKVLLASIRACSEGINLVGASRVVLLDVHWNPSVERQAISRAYRLGQKKLVHVYHLVTGCMEGEKYIRQVEKSHLSELVFSSVNRDSGIPKISSTVSEDKILEEMVQHDKLQHMFEKVIYQPKEADLIATFG